MKEKMAVMTLSHEFIKQTVLPRLHSMEDIAAMEANGIVHIPYLDMEVSFFCPVDEEGDTTKSIQITYPLLEKTGISVADVYDMACTHLKGICLVRSMGEVLGFEDPGYMWVVSTSSNVFGAAAILCPDLIRKVQDRVGTEFYVLPSSVHEVLAIPKDGSFDPAELAMLVQSVNEAEVRPEERLSNSAYVFNGHNLQIA